MPANAALTEEELLRALDELAEIVDIICAPIVSPAPAAPEPTGSRWGPNVGVREERRR